MDNRKSVRSSRKREGRGAAVVVAGEGVKEEEKQQEKHQQRSMNKQL